MNYLEDIKIDSTALDVELLNQPNLVFEYGKAYSKAVIETKKASQHLELVESDIVGEINANVVDTLGVGVKATEANKRSYIIKQTSYSIANNELLDAEENERLCKIAYTAIIEKKSSLENLVKLAIQGYFALPSTARDLEKESKAVARNKKKQAAANNKLSKNK